MKYKIGVFGSAQGNMEAAMPKAVEIGRALARQADSVIVVTGACPGLPYAAAKEAAANGAEVWGFASALDEKTHLIEYANEDIKVYKKLIYVPANFPGANSDRARKKYRNVISTFNCDAGIIISGLWGTLNEFTNLIDMQKTLGVLTGTGGVADELPALTQKISKTGQGRIIFDNNPRALVEKILQDFQS